MGARVLCWRCLRHMQAHVGMMVVGLQRWATKNMAPWHRKLGHGEAWAREVTSSLDGFFSQAAKKNQPLLGAPAASMDGFFSQPGGPGT